MQEKTTSINNFENCIKCRICVDACPAMKANPLYIGPKQAGPDGERLRLQDPAAFDESLKFCLNCKRCELACPSGVKIADIIHNARESYSHKRIRIRDFMLASTDLMGSLARPVAPLANAALATAPAKFALDRLFAVDAHRTFPKYASKSFEQWYRKEAAEKQKAFDRQVRYFHGCYVQNNFPELGKDFVKVMNALGYGVQLIEGEKCCGVPMIAAGMFNAAKKHARSNIDAIKGTSEPVVLTSTSCTLMLRDEYAGLLKMDNSAVRDRISHAVKFIYEAVSEGGAQLKWKESLPHVRVAYHVPCHMETLGWSIFTRRLMEMVPNLELIELSPACCGIAGTYGFKKENYATSQAIGKGLFDEIASINPDYVVCECETCKWQIEMSTPYKVLNPVSILAEALQ